MAYSELNTAFMDDKSHFFKQLREKTCDSQNTQERIDLVKQWAQDKTYDFLIKEQINCEAEFTQLFEALKKKRKKNNEAFWLYCYYCASLLEAFYKVKAYEKKTKAAEYTKLKLEIQNHLNKVKVEAKKEEDFITYLQKSFTDGLYDLATAPTQLSQLRNYVAFANLCRLFWVFYRLTLISGLNLARDLQLLDKLDAVLGTHIDVDKIISIVQSPNMILNYLSVGLFVARFMIDGGLLLRHTFFPSEEESNTSAYERFKYECYKRRANFANDLVWATVNFLTNFSHITHIPAPVGSALTAVFLGYDFLFLLYRTYWARQEYLLKKAQYMREFEATNDPDEKDILMAQLTELELSYQTKVASLHFAASAAALLALGFTSALVFSPPGIIVASFFVCTLAGGMYLSGDSYTKYKEKSLILEQAELSGKENVLARKEYEAAYRDFAFTLAKNTVIPSVLITTLAICWPAAVALTAVYLGYEVYHSYEKHNAKQEVERLKLNPPAEETKEETSSFSCW